MAPASDQDLAPLEDAPEQKWWKEAVVYQIYPASFFDSNGDGFGDINGITMKLDYIKDIGVDTVWLSPVYKSPQVDMGYDISDYRDIHPPYGTMADLDNLISETHKRGMKFVMDLVVNHTSDMHDWFQKSRSSKSSPFRDWYIWRPGRVIDGVLHPPNNWRSMFGGSTWTFDPHTSEYYLHCFAIEQPDLNWENPTVIKAVHDTIKFWLEKGVDGFRCDVINFISKAPGYPDAPVTDVLSEFQDASGLFANGPQLRERLQDIGTLLRAYNAFSVGEMPFAKCERQILDMVTAKSAAFDMIFQFDIIDMDIGPNGKFTRKEWNLPDLKRIVSKWQNLMYEHSGWNAIFSENHDQPRAVSRWASDLPAHRTFAAKLLATWLSCLGGTLYIYQGQELGMRNVPEEWPIEEYKDIETRNYWAEVLATTPSNEIIQQTKAQLQLKARDNSRTPVQWDSTSHGGFTKGPQPWMRVNPDYVVCNARAQVADEGSVYSYWTSMLSIRREYRDLFVYGDFSLIDESHPSIFAFERRDKHSKGLVVLNWSSQNVMWDLQSSARRIIEFGRLLETNYDRKQIEFTGAGMQLLPWEAVVFILEDII